MTSLDELIARQAILDCVTRYCQGMDRLDRELALSAYHDDAFDDHGFICARAAEFVDFVISRHEAGMSAAHQHHITGHLAEIQGDVAHGSTYFLYSAVDTSSPPQTHLHGGRYIDRFECREGRWAIADRVCILEWSGALGPIDRPVIMPAPVTGKAARDRSDIQYRRPLIVDRPASS